MRLALVLLIILKPWEADRSPTSAEAKSLPLTSSAVGPLRLVSVAYLAACFVAGLETRQAVSAPSDPLAADMR
jgi:hypothetical protein